MPERAEKLADGDDELGQLLNRAGEIKDRLDENNGDIADLRQQFSEVKAAINEQQAEKERAAQDAERAQMRADLDALLSSTRQASKAGVIVGQGQPFAADQHGWLFAVAMARSRDYDEQRWGKELLAQVGMEKSPALGKAIIGMADFDRATKATYADTNANGGFIIPNAVVTDINLQATPVRSAVDLTTVIDGVRGTGVQIPFEQGVPTRAVVALANATKENQNIVVGAYTATLYTLARIFDLGNQFLRQSEGAAEALVRSRLARAFGLGEDYYFLQGSGTNEPYGLLTALGTSGPYISTFSSPSSSTVAGSVISAVVTAAGAAANRGAQPDGVILNTADYYTNRLQGSDTAGFWTDPFADAPGVGQDAAGPLGLRWRHSTQMPTDSLVVGEYRAAQFFRGQGYRVDVSDEAGTRWDQNLTGFRGEEEIAFDGRPFVYAGYFQRITNAVP
jgi:HK97 family phage major capsid protein